MLKLSGFESVGSLYAIPYGGAWRRHIAPISLSLATVERRGLMSHSKVMKLDGDQIIILNRTKIGAITSPYFMEETKLRLVCRG